MRVLELFDKYFLILMIIQGGILSFIDSRGFKESNLGKLSRKSKLIGIVAILISIVFYLSTNFIR